MTEPDDTLKSEEPQQPRSGGPFSVEPVDPLIYRQSNDSPEMRAAAAYVPVASRRLRANETKPEKPQSQEHDQWTPGTPTPKASHAPKGPQEAPEPQARLSMRILTFLLILVPVALIVAAVAIGASLADF